MREINKGFTIIELSVVLVIIGILTTLVTTQLLRGQLVARDKERENDVKIIAGVFEEVYKSGQIDGVPIPTGDPAITTPVPMAYPSRWVLDSTDAQSRAIIGAIDPNALKSPLKKILSMVVASNDVGISGSTAGGRTIAADSTNDVYVYQPLQYQDSDLCLSANSPNPPYQKVIAPRYINTTGASRNCYQFKIYYLSESTNSIKTFTSKYSDLNGL